MTDGKNKAMSRWNNFVSSRHQANVQANKAYYYSDNPGYSAPRLHVYLGDTNAEDIEQSLLERKKQYEEIAQQEQDSQPWVVRAWKNTKDFVSQQASDLANSGRLWTKDLAEQFVDEDLSKIDNIVSENNDLELIKKYKALVYRKQQLDNYMTLDDFAEYNDIVSLIKELDEYFQGDGRHHTAVAQLMYNPNNLSTGDEIAMNMMYALKGKEGGSWGIDDVIPTAVGIFSWLGQTASQGLNNIFGGRIGTDNGYKTGEVVKRLKELGYNEGTINHFINELYVGSDKNVKNIQFQLDDKRIQDWIDYNNTLLEEKAIDLKNDIDFSKSGRLKYYVDLTNNNGNWLKGLGIKGEVGGFKFFDPEDIPDQFKNTQEEKASHWYSVFVHPIYTFPETASTVGLFKHQLGAMTGDAALGAALNWVVKKYPAYAAIAGAAQMTGSGLMGLDAAVKSRIDETGLEKILAKQERMLLDMQKRGVDTDKVFNIFRNFAVNKLKLDPSQLDEKTLLEIGISYDVPVNVEGYNEVAENAKKGIEQLVNGNNALAIHDYLETLPFLSYGGKALNRALSRQANKAIWGARAGLVEQQLSAVEQGLLKSGGALKGGFVEKVANKFFKEDAPRGYLFAKHTGDFLKSKFKIAAYEGFMESGEEGVQELLQSRYRRGEYDDYDKPESMFNVGEIEKVPGLYKDAILDYIGINPGDPDNASENVRKAMNIGFSASFMFSQGRHAFTNFRNDPSNTNITELYRQLKTDNVVGRMVGTYAEEAQDHNHISIFFDQFAKNNKSIDRVLKSLRDLKNNVDESNTLVKKSDLDADMRLARAANFMYNNEAINSQLKENGIKKNSDLHKQLVIDGTTAIVDALMTSDLISETRKRNNERLKNHYRLLDSLMNPNTPEDVRELILNENPAFGHLLSVLKGKYGIELEALKNRSQQITSGILGKLKTREDALTDENFVDWALQHDIDIYNEDDISEHINTYAKEYAPFLSTYGNLNHSSDKKSFARNVYIRGVLIEENPGLQKEDYTNLANEAFDNKSEKNRLILKAALRFSNGEISENFYNRTMIEHMHSWIQMNQLKKALEISKNQLERLLIIRKQTGLDINTNRLEGIVVQLQKKLKRYQDREKEILNGRNSKRGENNLLTYDKLFENSNVRFDDQEDYENDMLALHINGAMLIPQMSIASIYTGGMANNIQQLQEAIYGENTDESIIKDEVNEYLRKQAEEEAATDLDSDVTALNEAANKDDRKKISQRAAWKIIKKRLEESERRLRIARRNAEADLGLPENSLQREEHEQEEEEQSNQSEKPTRERKSTARSQFERDVLHGTGKDEKTGREKALEEIEKRKQAWKEADDDEELDDDEEFDDDFDEEESSEQRGSETADEEDKSSHSVETETPVIVAPAGVTTEKPAPLSNPKPDEESTAKEDKKEPETTEEDDDSSSTEILDEDNEVQKLLDEISEMLAEDDIEQQDLQSIAADMEDEAEREELDRIEDDLIAITDLEALYFDEEEQEWMYEDEQLSEAQAEAIETELLLLGLIETVGITQELLPDGNTMSKAVKRVLANKDSIGDLVSSTFFYQPEPSKIEGTDEDEVVHLRVNGKDLKFDKPIASGRKLAEKLTQKGWLESTNKYYVVSQPIEGATTRGDIRDTMTVALCLEDDSNTYIVTLRQLGTTTSEVKPSDKSRLSKEEKHYLEIWEMANEHGVFKDAESDLRMWLEMRNVDWSRILGPGQSFKDGRKLSKQRISAYRKAVMEHARESAKHWFISQNGDIAGNLELLDKKFEKWWTVGVTQGRMSSEEYAAKRADYNRQKQTFIDQARNSLTLPGKNALTLKLISAQILKLRDFRNQIIDAYTTKTKSGYVLPETPKKSVVPQRVNQSNGRFDNVSDHGAPVFRSIFDSTMSIDDILEEIESGNATFGYGTGAYGHEMFKIKAVLNKDNDTEFDGRGLSGKIYLFVESLANSAKRVPLMLNEERFDSQQKEDGSVVYRDDIQLCLKYDPSSNDLINVNTEGFKPSAAEILLYMLCDKFDMGVNDFEKRREIVEFFIHSGETTLLDHQPKYNIYPIKPFASKQLAWHLREDDSEYVLSIALPDGETLDGKQIYKVHDFTPEMLFGEGSEQLRLTVVKAIASQMHWNTDVAHMNNLLNPVKGSDSMSQFISYMLQKYNTDNGENLYDKTIEILGCPQLSLKVSDFFNNVGGLLKPKRNVSTLAWMLKNNKLMTDVSKKMFYAPFVFAEGVSHQNEEAEQIIEQTDEKLKPVDKKDVDKSFSLFSQPDLDWLSEEFDTAGLEVATTEDLAKLILQSLQGRSKAVENGGYRDRLLMVPPRQPMDIEDGERHFYDRLYKLIEDYNKLHPENPISKDNIESVSGKNERMIKEQYGAQMAYGIISIFNNGKISIQMNRTNSSSGWLQQVTGMFSKTGAEGVFDEKHARSWVAKTFGIDESNFIVTDAILKSTTDEQVFGLTNLCTDIVSGELTGYMLVSSQTGIGVTYHEAWHYINLLMHDSNVRRAIYRDYLKTHKKLNKKGVTIREVEEAMAEDFRKYVEAMEDKSMSGKVKRFFSRILDFLSASRKKSLYRNVFKLIQNGAYKGRKLDRRSVEEFHKKYPEGVHMLKYALPGHTYKETMQYDSLNTYQEYYDTVRSISNEVILNANINTVEDLLEYTKARGKFQEVMDTIEEIRDGLDPEEDAGYAILSTLLNNPLLVMKTFKESMLELGLKAKIRKVEDVSSTNNNDEVDPSKDGESTRNWDKVELLMSKKDNAAVRTKLFFRTIELLKATVLSDGTIKYVPDLDDYGILRMWSFDESWNLLLNELFACTSFGARDENGYLRSSIMGRVESLKDVSNFWHAVYKKLSKLDQSKATLDILLKSLIFSTLCSSKNQISFIQLENPKALDFFDEYDDELDDFDDYEDEGNTYESSINIEDRSRVWKLMGDNALAIARNIPRRWSKNLASKGFVKYNSETGKSVVNELFVDKLEQDYKVFLKKLKSSKDKTDIDYRSLVFGKDGIIKNLLDILQYIGIPADRETMNVFIALHSKNKSNKSLNAKSQFEILQKVFENTSQGSIDLVIQSIIDSKGMNVIKASGRASKERLLDEVFDNYKMNSQIAILATAYNEQHPNLQDYSVKGPNDDTYYPINQNNFNTSTIRGLNDKASGLAEDLRRSAYCSASLILDAAESVDEADEDSKIRLNTFVGMKDANKAKGADYFGITDIEDYLAKMYMTELDQIVFPTMADKKTWYSLSSKNIQLVHDVILDGTPDKFIKYAIFEEYLNIKPYDKDLYNALSTWRREAENWYRDLSNLKKSDENYENARKIIQKVNKRSKELLSEKDLSGIGINEFSNRTLTIFANYFISELDALIQYYDRRHIQHMVENQNDVIENYHGEIVEMKLGGQTVTRMDWSGNGGKFRYFYDVITFKHGGKTINLNQRLQALYELQLKIESGTVKNTSSSNRMYPNVGMMYIQERDGKNELLPTDGFELIRKELKDLKKLYQDQFTAPTEELKQLINKKLLSMVLKEIDFVTTDGSTFQLGKKMDNGKIVPLSIPALMLNKYLKVFQERELTSTNADPYAESSSDIQHLIFYNLMASYTLNSIISTIEMEKIFSGDPAFYKWKQNKADKNLKFKLTHSLMLDGSQESAVTMTEEVSVENLDDTYSDKIKRLGGTLSPGAEMRLDFSDIELEDPNNQTLQSTQYTVLNVEDVKVPSSFIEEIYDNFKKQLVVDWIRCDNPKEFTKVVEKTKSEGINVGNFEHLIDLIYNNGKFYDRVLKAIPSKKMEEIETMLLKQIKPYKQITVADAQVFIRPELYRKIKIGLGEWSFKQDKDGYSDEIAYQLIENNTYKGKKVKDGAWMSDPTLYKIVKKFQTNTLKMSYFLNATHQIYEDQFVNKPIYNKMAIFPIFKYHRSTNIGRMLYERMNDSEKGCIDMISFKSAVKVGAVQKGPKFVSGVEAVMKDGKLQNKEQVQNAVSTINSVLNLKSQRRVDYTTDEVITNSGETLPISVLDLKNLRLQLNTHAHESTERAIGTQMFKIAFSNIIDDAEYGTGKSGRKPRKGFLVKRDIMRCINALTDRGIGKLRERFYKKIEKDGSVVTVLDQKEIENFVKSIISSNGLGVSAEDIIASGGTVASLMLRQIFEQSASSLINSEVIDINTKGGTAIQLSMYGFAADAFGNESVSDYDDEYVQYNDGKELKWSAKEGSMEVLLSMNFFKAVVPKDMQGSYSEMRQWLIDNDVIKGTKTDGKKSNPKPFGIGYRIPTQGMSSMFGFIVADVLPEQVGDLIIVPREFTAQTGSDFDVDKLYLATYSYKDGVREQERFAKKDSDEVVENTTGAISNTLLDNYLDIITDQRNYSNARASIDVITNIIQEDLLDKVLRTRRTGYRSGMSLLLPSFQCSRKREFGVGKTGIGPFALNITNMALTQYTHLTFDYGQNEYNFGDLDEIYGQDGLRIADWLSAMVNAHVDVAKDAYVFDLNVNQITYNHTNFLLRAGKGKKTFLFLAQPALKQYAEELMNAGGMYGGYISENESESKKTAKKTRVRDKIISQMLNDIENLAASNDENWTENQISLIQNVIRYYRRMIMNKALREQYGLVDPIERIEGKDVIFANDARSENAIKSLKNPSKSNPSDLMDAMIFQLYALESFEDINKYAEAISGLVSTSGIDTKKFGNNIVSQFNYENNINQFRYTGTLWTINEDGFVKSLPKKKNAKGEEEELNAAEISKYALNRYYDTMFLSKKFNAALKYERALLSGQSFKASDLFKQIFFEVCRQTQGASTVVDTDGNEYYGYEKIYNDDVVLALGNGIDDIIRFNSFMAVGYEEYKNIYTKNQDVIDFTLGGDMNAVRENMKRLLFGRYEQDQYTELVAKAEGSIFERTSTLIDKLKSDVRNPLYRGLVNKDGDIINDLLLYITPILPNDKFPIGRMILKEPSHGTKGDRKGRLIAAFSELLTSSDPEIQNLAKDLAFYAYFSTYDQNTRNSFFDLVPPRFRLQYDRSLKHVLRDIRSKNELTKIDVLNRISGNNVATDIESALQNASNTILDVLSRNYWYDDNYVKAFRIPEKSKTNLQGSGTMYGMPVMSKQGEDTFPTWIVSSRVRGDSLYTKIRSKGGHIMLYRRIGTINQTAQGKRGAIKGETFGVYAAVPKAGVHRAKLNHFELYCDYYSSSIFDSNRISKQFAEDVVKQEIENHINRENSSQDNKYKLSIDWQDQVTRPERVSDNLDVYSPQDAFERQRINGALFTYSPSAQYNANREADVIIDLNNLLLDESGKNVSKQHKSKSVEVGMNTDLSTIIDQILKLSEGSQESGITLSFTTSLYDGQWDIPENVFNLYLNAALEQYKSTLSQSDENIESLVDTQKQLLENDRNFKKSVIHEYVKAKVNDILLTVIDEVNVKRVLVAMNDGQSVLSMVLADLHKDRSNDYVDGITYIYADQKIKNRSVWKAKSLRKQLLEYFKQKNESAEMSDSEYQEIVETELEEAVDNEEQKEADKNLPDSEDSGVEDFDEDFDDEDIESMSSYGSKKEKAENASRQIIESARQKWTISYEDEEDFDDDFDLDDDISEESKNTDDNLNC